MNINVAKLRELVAAAAAGNHGFVSYADGKPMQDHNPPLIQVNTEIKDEHGNVAARATEAATAFLASSPAGGSVAPAGASASPYAVMTGFVAPAARRRGKSAGTGAPSKYPFADLQVGQSFYVPNSDVDSKDAFKTLSATVSSANRRNSEETGEIETVTRAKRGADRKAIIDPATGNKVMETVQQPKRRPLKHYKIVAVEAGKDYSGWTPNENGAVVIRDL